ncbi:NAD(P)-binding protein [Cadophora sp. DSE1049]|nr:NAD(P)-binding protein [Cadophora sp. DSE1049]
MSEQLIVITGVSGHVGFNTLALALARGYRVRAIVRRADQGEKIKKTSSVKPYVANLEIVVVSDLLKPGAFDGVLDGACGVLHIASPLAIETDNYKRDIIDPAVDVTVGILKSTAKAPSIKRVVITSSIATILTWEYIISDDYTKVFITKDTYKPADASSHFDMPIQAYAAAKGHARVATYKFLEEERPHFDVINILPSMVIGKNELNTKKEDLETGTNGTVIGPLIGIKQQMPNLGVSVHVTDVARAHLDALNPEIPGNQDLLCSSGGLAGTSWDDAKEIAKKLYGKHVASGLFSLDGTSPSRPLRFDASETEKLFGWKFASFESQVQSVADHYIELAGAQ